MPVNSNTDTFDYIIVGAGSAGCVRANGGGAAGGISAQRAFKRTS